MTLLLVAGASMLAVSLLVRRVLLLRPGTGGPRREVSVIIPARNEATTLPGLLDDLARQGFRPLQVVVVDDESEDETADAAMRGGATVVSTRGRPDGWNPKVWALTVGARAATAPVLVFLDADVRLEDGALAAVVDLLAREGGVVSVAPAHLACGAVESLSAIPNVVSLAGAGPGFGRRSRGAVGCCIAVAAEDYEAIGGHAARPATIVDDMELARTARRHDLPVTLRRGGGAVTMRSYPDGLAAVVAGWSKNLAAGITHTRPTIALVVTGWVVALLTPLTLAAQGEVGLAGAVWALVALHTWHVTRMVGSFDVLVVTVGAPLLGVAFALLTLRSVLVGVVGRPVRWRGRRILPSGLERGP